MTTTFVSKPLLKSTPVAILAMALFASFVPAGALRAESLRAERIEWRDLRYRASKLFITAEARVSLEQAGEEVRLLLGSEVLGRTSETRIWLDPSTAETRREEKLKIHRDAGLRTYDYEADHALKVRYHERPVDQAHQPLETWREKSRERQDFGAAAPSVVTTPSALLYLLGASSLEKKGDTLDATLFADERLVRTRAEVVAEEAFDGEIEILGGGSYRPQVALRIRLTGREASGGGEPVALELLGLEGDLEVLLDRDKRLPLAIRGGMPVLGRIDVKLRAARFR